MSKPDPTTPNTHLRKPVEAFGDGWSVWVNDTDGTCLARFGRFGIDIHKDTEGKQYGRPTSKDWEEFLKVMVDVYDIIVPEKLRPSFLPKIEDKTA